jgi:hypothetical protein
LPSAAVSATAFYWEFETDPLVPGERNKIEGRVSPAPGKVFRGADPTKVKLVLTYATFTDAINSVLRTAYRVQTAGIEFGSVHGAKDYMDSQVGRLCGCHCWAL